MVRFAPIDVTPDRLPRIAVTSIKRPLAPLDFPKNAAAARVSSQVSR
jgi:hypothetical protein